MIELSDIAGYKDILAEVIKKKPIKIRGETWREMVPELIATLPMSEVFFRDNMPKFSTYLAHGRVDCIASFMPWDELLEQIGRDPYNRQMIVYRPDWFWSADDNGDFGHVNCVLAYQFVYRKDHLSLHVFMRSSDFFNAFPYDWFAAAQHLKVFARKASIDKNVLATADIYWHISNLHVRDKDVKRIERFLR